MSSLRLGTLALVLSACSGAPSLEVSNGVAVSRAPIVNGEDSDTEDDQVVELVIPGAQICSGSMIAPNVVLTALHCVTYYDTGGVFTCKPDGSLTTSTPPDGQIGTAVPPEKIEIRSANNELLAHGLKVFGTDAVTICTNDVAVLVIDEDLDLPLASMRFGRTTERGEYARIVGFGQTEQPTSSGRHRRDDVRIVDVGSDGINDGSKTTAPHTLVVGEGPCHGDSGGPALSEDTRAIVGVYSLLVGATCVSPGVRNVYTQVAPFESLIREALDYAGHEPILETIPSTGEGGAGGDVTTGQGGSEASSLGGSGNDSATASGGSDPTNTSGGTDVGQGSGSRRDPSCTCRTAPSSRHAAAWGVGALFGLAALCRRAKRA